MSISAVWSLSPSRIGAALPALAGMAPMESRMQTTGASVNLSLDPVNDVPSFTAGAARLWTRTPARRLSPAGHPDISAGPANEGGQVLTFTLSTGNDALFAVLPAIDATTGDVTYTPADDLYGSCRCDCDAQGRRRHGQWRRTINAPQTFAITVRSSQRRTFLHSGGRSRA